jgi:hypothetical protein
MSDPYRRNLGLAAGTVLATSTTLVCCVLPAVMVAVGAGSVLASLVATVPQLVWLSEHKGAVFSFAGLCLLASGIALWRARLMPCPTDVNVAAQCARRRRLSVRLYGVSVILFAVGATFAFLLPLFGAY